MGGSRGAQVGLHLVQGGGGRGRSALVIGSELYLARRNSPAIRAAEPDLTSPAPVARASTSAGVSAAAGAEPAAAKPRSIAA